MADDTDSNCFALFDDNFSSEGRSILFENPERFILAHNLEEAKSAFIEIDRATAEGFYVAGCFSYELAPAIDPAFKTHDAASGTPLIQVGVYKSKKVLADDEVDRFLLDLTTSNRSVAVDVNLTESQGDYVSNIRRIKSYIEAGDTYQVNHTIRARFEFEGCPVGYYSKLRESQKVTYGGLLVFPDQTILSRSPELFFRKDDDRLVTKPMKGTAPRHKDVQADTAATEALRTEEKTIAENLMIVDLLRNDLSRIADPGTVAVDALFDVETYQTVHQMTSTISCRVSPEESLKYLFAGLFPCGSVTGAPKVRTMQIICELESTPRGYYTGAIGYVTPENDMRFSVPIRTISIGAGGAAELGIGSGIVYDSNELDEYAETLLKSRFALGPATTFDLLESLYADPQSGIRNLQAHLDRVQATASVFLYPFDREDVERRLSEAAQSLTGPGKLRMTIDRNGRTSVTAALLEDSTTPKSIVLWDDPVDSRRLMYAYKTTDRKFYDDVWAAAAKEYGAYDVVFVNQHGELTETSRHNIFLRFGDRYVTPPLGSGILPGIQRAAFIAENAGRVTETALYPEDLQKADEIILSNSVRGMVSVRLHPESCQKL